jgi:hypothetical protein
MMDEAVSGLMLSSGSLYDRAVGAAFAKVAENFS